MSEAVKLLRKLVVQLTEMRLAMTVETELSPKAWASFNWALYHLEEAGRALELALLGQGLADEEDAQKPH